MEYVIWIRVISFYFSKMCAWLEGLEGAMTDVPCWTQEEINTSLSAQANCIIKKETLQFPKAQNTFQEQIPNSEPLEFVY